MNRPAFLLRTITIFLIPVTIFFLFSSFKSTSNSLDKEVLYYTNKYRKSKGLPALEMRNDLNAIAARHSEAMARGKRSFGHGGYSQRQNEVQRLIQPFSGMAENVAYGAENAKDVINLWKNSSGHKKNLLGQYRYIGIATARSRSGVLYYTQIFVR